MNLFSFIPWPSAGTILLWLGGLVLVVLLFREVVTWYWKINRVVTLLEKIEHNTHKEESEIKK